MKVKDLIEMLQKLNPDAEIVEPSSNMVLKERYSYYEENGWVDETQEISENIKQKSN